MWNKPDEKRLATLPKLYATENIPTEDKIVHLHFFIGGSDWYAVEFDGEDTFFGYAILNNDFHNAEWGYFSLKELDDLKVPVRMQVGGKDYSVKMAGKMAGIEVDCEADWAFKPRPAKEVRKICQGMG